MFQIKLFESFKQGELERSINTFLQEVQSKRSITLTDIKFNSYNYGEDRTECFSAMVIYKINP